jgi:NAD(P)-dependent dehydrogenase (short-subunit alcohol dehydrogenase family)
LEKDAFGKVDIVVNAAGISKRGPTLDFSTADWNRIMDTNLTGTPRLARSSGAT